MKRLLDSDIDRLRLLSGGDRELRFDRDGEVLRIDLREDYIQMWQDEAAVKGNEANLFLACENSGGNLEATKLTWVVGSAIRPETVQTKEQFTEILLSLGVSKNLASMALEHCPGLIGTIAWALYFERHGWLTATPICNL
ncbi:hypothetical protein MY494_06590 [Synechococcus sp. A10-1-5-1]|uniref:hypothetical protein n=1 Tax=Synechococcus sp. A10-1-5-1 TaxID=2936507 RepID=UPI0020015D72|nr:hypothetical protein [Synechococcus sp. A10-1-5-1]UPM51409.1 hypothetical protein MY494_06590 [Synechococcus sp. A10-1-5-1]